MKGVKNTKDCFRNQAKEEKLVVRELKMDTMSNSIQCPTSLRVYGFYILVSIKMLRVINELRKLFLAVPIL